MIQINGYNKVTPPPKKKINKKNTNSAIFAFSSWQLLPSLAAEHTNSLWAGVAC